MSRGPYPVMLMLAMALPGAARALGLGEIRVDSGLNEPLSAQIDIVGATRDDLAALTAKVAGRDVFQHYGADRPSFLSSATFKVGLDAQGRPVLNIRSADAFTDPVIDFLVDISWGKGELIREYSLLLDPPGFASATRTTEVAAARAAPAPLATGVAPAARVPSSPTSASAPTAAAITPHNAITPHAQDAPTAAFTASQLRVAAGDTLRGIARRAGARTEADAQRLMIAIFRANPHAFEGNINLLHSGAVLRIPSDSEVEAIDAAGATREVRAQTTDWLHATLQSVAAANPSHSPLPSGPAQLTSPAQELRMRVQSLEQTLDAVHRELAAKDARIQDLKQLTADQAASQPAASLPAAPLPKALQPTASPPTASQAAAPLPAASLPAASLPAASLPAAAPLLSTVHPSPAAAPGSGAPLHAELMQSQPHLVPVLAPVAPPPAPPLVDKAQLGSMAVALAVLLGGFAYFRRRLVRVGAELPRTPIGYVPPDPSAIERPEPQGPRQQPADPVAAPVSLSPEQLEQAPRVVAADALATTAPLAVLADALDAGGHTTALGAGYTASRDAGQTVSLAPLVAPKIPTHTPAEDDTDYMGIDTQALERSYLEGLSIESISVDTATHTAVPYDPATAGAALDDTASHEAVPYDPSLPDEAAQRALDAMVASYDLQTLALERPKVDARKTELKPLESANLDYNLIDLDATAHHVHLSGDLHDQPNTVERRMNLVDVLKSAIERDPHRRDLVLKLLETYYGVVSTNQRAFLDVVRKLPHEPDFLSKDDWRKVQMMGRDIAPRDPLFAGDTQVDLLPSFA